MKLPRDVDGDQLVRALSRYGYAVIRQTGSHVRMKATDGSEFPVTVPQHTPLKIGTLASILDDVAGHAGISREELLEQLEL